MKAHYENGLYKQVEDTQALLDKMTARIRRRLKVAGHAIGIAPRTGHRTFGSRLIGVLHRINSKSANRLPFRVERMIRRNQDRL